MRALILIGLVACGSPGPGGTGGGSGTGGGGTGTAGGVGSQLDRQALSGTRLKVQYVAGDDGSRQFWGFRDTMRNENCNFATAEDGVLRCLPTGDVPVRSSDFYADSACSEFAFTRYGAPCPVQNYGVAFPLTCPQRSEVYALQPISSVYVRTGTGCFTSTPDPMYRLFRGTKVPASSFAGGSLQTE